VLFGDLVNGELTTLPSPDAFTGSGTVFYGDSDLAIVDSSIGIQAVPMPLPIWN